MPTAADITNPYGVGSSAYNLAGNTANSNLAASGSMIQLADIINATNRAAQTAANNARLGPQGVDTQNTLLTNAQQEAQGLLDPQTEQMLQQGIAAQGNASGMGVDSANLAAAYRRALGQTINTTEQQGQSNYLALLAANPSAPIYDMSGQLVSPATYASTAAANLPSTGTGGGGGGGTRIGGGNPVGATPAQNNNVPYGGGYPGGAGQYSTAPTSVLDSLYASSYIPGGSSPFGLISTGGGNTVDMFDPLAGSAAGLPTYGTMPDYSQPGTDPIAAALGMGPSGLPANTVYSPTTDTYDYTYGVPSYYSSSGPSYYSGGGGGDYSDLGDYYGP